MRAGDDPICSGSQKFTGAMINIRACLQRLILRNFCSKLYMGLDAIVFLYDFGNSNCEMVEIYNRAGLRESTVISPMAKAGCHRQLRRDRRPSDWGSLRHSHAQGRGKVRQCPVHGDSQETLSKARHQYFTFLTGTVTRQVTAYLNDRLAHGESLHGGSPVVSPDYVHRTNRGRNSTKDFLPTSRVSKIVRDTFRPRFTWRPYVLRAYFDTQLLMGLSPNSS